MYVYPAFRSFSGLSNFWKWIMHEGFAWNRKCILLAVKQPGCVVSILSWHLKSYCLSISGSCRLFLTDVPYFWSSYGYLSNQNVNNPHSLQANKIKLTCPESRILKKMLTYRLQTPYIVGAQKKSLLRRFSSTHNIYGHMFWLKSINVYHTDFLAFQRWKLYSGIIYHNERR